MNPHSEGPWGYSYLKGFLLHSHTCCLPGETQTAGVWNNGGSLALLSVSIYRLHVVSPVGWIPDSWASHLMAQGSKEACLEREKTRQWLCCP